MTTAEVTERQAHRQHDKALSSYALATSWWDQKEGKSYSNNRSSFFRFRRGDRAAKLTHEDSHVIGATFLRNLRRILILHTHTVIGDGQLDLVANLSHAQHNTSCPVRKSMLDGACATRSRPRSARASGSADPCRSAIAVSTRNSKSCPRRQRRSAPSSASISSSAPWVL